MKSETKSVAPQGLAPGSPAPRDVALAVVAALALLAVDLGRQLPTDTSQARVPVAARTMSRDGFESVAALGGLTWSKKPPGAVWLQAASMRLFGDGLGAAAVPAVVLAVAVAVALARRGGLFAGLILLLSPRFLLSARGTEMDIVFACITTLAILRGLDEIRGGGRVGWLSQLLLGAAILVKGPLCLVFAALAWGRAWLAPALLALPLLPVGWLVWATIEHPGLPRVLLLEMQVGAGDEETTHAGPFHEHLLSLLGLAAPATIPLLILGLETARSRLGPFLRRTGPRRPTEPVPPAGERTPRASPISWARELFLTGGASERVRLLAWFLGGLLVLSLMAKKQTSYALPIYPPLALLAADAVRTLDRSAALAWCARGLAACLAFGVAAAGWWVAPYIGLARVVAAAGVAGCGAVWTWRARSGTGSYGRLLWTCVPLFLLAVLPGLQEQDRALSLAPAGEAFAARIRAEPDGGTPEAATAVLGRGMEPVVWGFGHDLPRVDSLDDARARGRRFVLTQDRDPEADEPTLADVTVLLSIPHPRHPRRQLELLDLAP